MNCTLAHSCCRCQLAMSMSLRLRHMCITFALSLWAVACSRVCRMGLTFCGDVPCRYVINNLCSECGTGADLALNGDGRFPVSFNIVPCPSGKRRMSSRRLLESEDVS